MNPFSIFLFVVLLFLATPLLGHYMTVIFQGGRSVIRSTLGKLEELSYRLGKIDPGVEMTWTAYTKALLWFNAFGLIAVFLLQLTQYFLPLNPQQFPSVEPTLALNTAISFVTNTDWQSYTGESTLSYLTQMAGLGVQNFLSAATGLAVFVALARGITRKSVKTIGNFWCDIVRSVVYILLPLSIIFAIILGSQGVVQTFSPYVEAVTLEQGKQIIPLGPVASQVAIKQLGTNGGGFFNANSAHPFENPTPLSNFLEMFAMIFIPAALTYTYGSLIGSKKQGWILFSVMFFVWIAGVIFAVYAEYHPNPVFSGRQLFEGVETRVNLANTALWIVTTAGTANGSINGMISSASPLAGGIALFNIMLGEHIFGGIGVGLCTMVMFVLVTVFLAGLMVGRTPEYLGKKIEKREIQWVVLAVLGPSALILIGAGWAILRPETLSSLGNRGPHALSEVIYAITSAVGNNGSAFAGFNANTPFFNLLLGVLMLLGRLFTLIPSLAIASLLAQKNTSPPSAGTFSTDTVLFAVMLLGAILIIGALTFFPVLSLGPIVEHLLMLRGISF